MSLDTRLEQAHGSGALLASELPARRHQQIRILFVIDQLKLPFGGAEEVLRGITARLPEHGFSPEVITFAMDQDAPGLFTCPVHLFPMWSAFDANAARMAVRFVRYLWRTRPHVVHTFFESSDLWAGTIAKLTSRAALVSSRRDMGIQRSRMHDLAYRMTKRLPDKVITVSDQVKRFVIEKDGISPDRVTTVYNGVVAPPPRRDKSEIRRELRIPSDSPVVVAVGNIRRIKGFDVLLRAASSVLSRMPNTHFIIVGGVSESDYMAQLDELVRELELDASIHFVGHQRDVASYLAASDLFVLPSRSEGFSNALLQAMAAGLPCIATSVGGNQEAIKDQVSGYTASPDDVSAISSLLGRLIADSQLRRRMGESARRAVQESFSEDQMIEKLVGLYEELTQA